MSQISDKICEDQLSVNSIKADCFLGRIQYFLDLPMVINPSNQISCLSSNVLCHLIVFEIISESELELLLKLLVVNTQNLD